MVVALPRNPRIKTYDTQDYLNVLRAADTQTIVFLQSAAGSNVPSLNPDGLLNQSELSAFQDRAQKSISYAQQLQSFFQFFIPSFGGILKQYIDDLNKKLDISKIMLNNYDRFANPSGRNNPGFAAGNQISRGSIFDVAWTDGNPYNVSSFDVRPLRFA
jgi:hypothetical protein